MPEQVPTTASPPPEPATLRWETATCAICGSDSASFLIEVRDLIYDRPGSARIVRCDDCGHLYQNPRPTRDTIGLCYGEDYGPHTHNLRATTSATAGPTDTTAPASPDVQPDAPRWYLTPFARSIPGLRSLYRWLSSGSEAPVPVPPSPDAKALEIGCGSGGYLQRLLLAGWQVEGIEFADGPAARCRQLGFRVHTTGIEDADLVAGTYDLVVAWMVVEHLHEPGPVLEQVRELLTPAGTLMISVPNTDCWELWAMGRYHFILNEPTHLQHFSVTSIRRLLESHGFAIDNIEYQKNVYNIVGSIGIALNSRFPRWRIGKRMLAFCDNPSMWGRLALAPLAKLLAAMGQSGRITIIAKPIPPTTGQA